ncbi:peptidase [Rhodovulum strictum]|uniref:Peptidase n=2 Tax=Rhodovulum strictum TaxID=58314 RepID=A0A844BMX9_9RHOB|nr:peptidase [Rhodovulum strictum]
MKPISVFLLVCLGLSAGLALPAAADRDRDHDRAREALIRGEILPLHAILPDLETQFGGRVIKVELEREKRRLVYELKLITPEGRIVEIEVDAATGAILDTEIEDD